MVTPLLFCSLFLPATLRCKKKTVFDHKLCDDRFVTSGCRQNADDVVCPTGCGDATYVSIAKYAVLGETAEHYDIS